MMEAVLWSQDRDNSKIWDVIDAVTNSKPYKRLLVSFWVQTSEKWQKRELQGRKTKENISLSPTLLFKLVQKRKKKKIGDLLSSQLQQTFPKWNDTTATYLVLWRENGAQLCTLSINKNEHALQLLYSGVIFSTYCK